MSLNTVAGLIAALVLIAVFVLALVGQMTWVMAGLFGGLAVALLLSGRVSTP